MSRATASHSCSVGTWFAFGATRRIFYGYPSYGRLFDVHWDRVSLVFSEIGSVLWSAGWALPCLLPLAALIAALLTIAGLCGRTARGGVSPSR
jgi:hypothetical protein